MRKNFETTTKSIFLNLTAVHQAKASNTETYRHLTVAVTIHKARFPSNRLFHGDGE